METRTTSLQKQAMEGTSDQQSSALEQRAKETQEGQRPSSLMETGAAPLSAQLEPAVKEKWSDQQGSVLGLATGDTQGGQGHSLLIETGAAPLLVQLEDQQPVVENRLSDQQGSVLELATGDAQGSQGHSLLMETGTTQMETGTAPLLGQLEAQQLAMEEKLSDREGSVLGQAIGDTQGSQGHSLLMETGEAPLSAQLEGQQSTIEEKLSDQQGSVLGLATGDTQGGQGHSLLMETGIAQMETGTAPLSAQLETQQLTIEEKLSDQQDSVLGLATGDTQDGQGHNLLMETGAAPLSAQLETRQISMEEKLSDQEGSVLGLAARDTQGGEGHTLLMETGAAPLSGQFETRQPVVEELLDQQDSILAQDAQDDQGGECTMSAQAHCVVLESRSNCNSHSETIFSSQDSQHSATEPDKTSDLKQPVTGDFISLENLKNSAENKNSLSLLDGRKKGSKGSVKECSSIDPVMDAVESNPVSSCDQGSHAGHVSPVQAHSELAHIESALDVLDCGADGVTSQDIEEVELTHDPSHVIDASKSETGTSDSESSSESSDDPMGIEQELKENGYDSEEEKGRSKNFRHGYPMSKGEINYKDLPPIDECNIPFPENGRLLPIGKVSHYSEKLVVIESLEGTPPVNEGTVLWSEDKRALVVVFEIFGPVKKPYYSVRVNSQDHACTMGLSPGTVLYVVPASLELTHYVFTRELVNQKGTDASWKDDIEVPSELQDYSDDEMEKKVSGKRRGKGGRSRGGHSPSVNPNSSAVSNSTMQPYMVEEGELLQPVRPHTWHLHPSAQPQGMHAGVPHLPYPAHVHTPPINHQPTPPLIGGRMAHHMQPSAHYHGNPALLHIPTSGIEPPASYEELYW